MILLYISYNKHISVNNTNGLLFKHCTLSGPLIGGIAKTQETLDFCVKHNNTLDVEIISIQKVSEAYERLSCADVKYRFSIDMAP